MLRKPELSAGPMGLLGLYKGFTFTYPLTFTYLAHGALQHFAGEFEPDCLEKLQFFDR